MTGAKYDLEDFKLPCGTLGLSNEGLGGKVEIAFHTGNLLLCVPRV